MFVAVARCAEDALLRDSTADDWTGAGDAFGGSGTAWTPSAEDVAAGTPVFAAQLADKDNDVILDVAFTVDKAESVIVKFVNTEGIPQTVASVVVSVVVMATKGTMSPPWWRHQMETFSALLALCAANSPVTGEFPAERPVTRSLDVCFDPHLNKRLSKQSSAWGWWFETPLYSLSRYCNVGGHWWIYSPGPPFTNMD